MFLNQGAKIRIILGPGLYVENKREGLNLFVLGDIKGVLITKNVIMKKPQMKTRFLAVLALGAMMQISCEKDTADAVLAEDQETFETAQLLQADESDWITEEIVNVGEEVYSMGELSVSGKGVAISGFIPDCVTITTVTTDTTVEKTIDFGEGCELPNGNVLSGIIFMSYAKDMQAATKTIELELSGFTFNEIAVEGGASLLRQRENEAGNPQSAVASAFNATWPDGETASWEGNRTREWIEGYGSGFWGDNVFLITGSRTLVTRAGNTFNRTVIEPLRREWSCRFLVSGVLQINRNDLTAELDFGDGSCDAFGELTYPNGETETITLRRFRK